MQGIGAGLVRVENLPVGPAFLQGAVEPFGFAVLPRMAGLDQDVRRPRSSSNSHHRCWCFITAVRSTVIVRVGYGGCNCDNKLRRGKPGTQRAASQLFASADQDEAASMIFSSPSFTALTTAS